MAVLPFSSPKGGASLKKRCSTICCGPAPSCCWAFCPAPDPALRPLPSKPIQFSSPNLWVFSASSTPAWLPVDVATL